MPFTVEFEKENDSGNVFFLSYLELGLERELVFPKGSKISNGSRISAIWMRKVYHSLCMLHYLSYHTFECRYGLISNMLKKAIMLTSSVNMLKAISKWFDDLTISDYPAWILVNVAYYT